MAHFEQQDSFVVLQHHLEHRPDWLVWFSGWQVYPQDDFVVVLEYLDTSRNVVLTCPSWHLACRWFMRFLFSRKSTASKVDEPGVISLAP